MWNKKWADLLDLCKRFYKVPDILSRQSKMYKVASLIIHDLCKDKCFHGVGPMGANLFVQISSLLGLIPLCCYNYAEINSALLGPAKLIKSAFPKLTKVKEVCEEYNAIHAELKNCLGPQVTKLFLENTLCKLSRCVNASLLCFRKHNPNKNIKLPAIDTVTSFPKFFKESKMKDYIYHDKRRESPQNFFRVVIASKKATPLNPVLVMKHSPLWKLGPRVWQHNLTNWNKDKKDNRMVYWSNSRGKMTLDTKLETSQKFDELMLLCTKD